MQGGNVRASINVDLNLGDALGEINKLKSIDDVKEYLFNHLNEFEQGILKTYGKDIEKSLEDFGAGIEAKRLPLAGILGCMSIENNIQDLR